MGNLLIAGSTAFEIVYVVLFSYFLCQGLLKLKNRLDCRGAECGEVG